MPKDLNEKDSKQVKDADDQQALPKDFYTIIAGIIPNTRYFDARFDLLQAQIDDIRRGQDNIKEEMKFRFSEMERRFDDVKQDMDRRFDDVKQDMDRRFEQVDKRFEQVDRRFEQVDRRFEQVDKKFEQIDRRFEQIIASIDRLSDKLDNRDKEHRNFTLRMFSISIAILILGVLGAFLKTMGVF